MVRLTSIATLSLLVLLAPALAHAHPLIDQARRAYDRARHDRALELLQEAEDGEDLTRDDLVELLLLRAMAHRAQRDMELAEVDMFRLAELDPERQLGREIHPQLRRLFDRVRERVTRAVRINVRAAREGEVVTIEAEVTDDVAALAQGFRIFGRAAGGSLQQTSEPRLEIHVPASQAAEYWAEVIGPGGAVIATHASEASPARVDAVGGGGGDAIVGSGDGDGGDGDAFAGDGSGDTGGGGGEDEGVPAWPFIVGGITLAVAAAVIVTVIFTVPSDDSQLTAPRVENLVSAPLVLLRFE